MTPITQRGRRLCSQRLWDGELLLLQMFLMLLWMFSWWRIRNDLMTLSLHLLVRIIQIIIIRNIFLLIFWFCCWFWSLSDSENMFFVFLCVVVWTSFCSFSRKGLNMLYLALSHVSSSAVSLLEAELVVDLQPRVIRLITMSVCVTNVVLVFLERLSWITTHTSVSCRNLRDRMNSVSSVQLLPDNHGWWDAEMIRNK